MRQILPALLLAILLTPPASAQFSTWTISEMQPDIVQGGRANTISVHPTNNDTILVASESGGLFRSTDHGVTWRHIDGLPEYRMGAVAYLPADPTIVIATVARDFKTVNGGGIWRSTDGGTTWTQMPSPPAPPCQPAPFCVPEPVTANEISIAPDSGTIYVATSYGVSYSGDRGGTWTHVNPFGAGDRRVFSVVALQNNLVIAGGIGGIRRSTTGGMTWVASSSGAGGMITDIHAFSRSPYWIDQAYVVNDQEQLYYTENGGDTWTQISAAPGRPPNSACGGIAFIKAQAAPRIPPVVPNPPDRSILLWYGNRCGLYTLACPELGARTFNYSGTWATMSMDHGDTRDLAFENTGRALLLGTDGGLHSTADGGTHWTFTGGGHNGYNALQITEVKGQAIATPSKYDLYFGTQDNSLWASGDAGRSWSNPVCCEGWFIEAERRAPRPADSQITFVANSGSSLNYLSGELFTGVAQWRDTDAPAPPTGNPKFIARSLHVQGVNGPPSAFTTGYAYTTNLGMSWLQYATFPENRLDLPKLSQPGPIPVLYQPIRTGFSGGRNIDKLARITRRVFFPTAFVTYPTMNRFGGLGINPTMFAWYEVFGVDPGNTRHLIAPDVVNRKMMETWDAGNNWTEIPALTSLVTDSGRFLFAYDYQNATFPHASAVSFNRDNPNLVAVGTHQGGVLVSSDRGATWSRVTGSDRATYITSIEWKSASEAIISTYGRGLWRMSWRFILQPPWFDSYCKAPCVMQPFVKADPNEPYTSAILAFQGRLTGARASNGVLQEVFVTPASSVVFFSNSDPGSVKVTESDTDAGFQGVTPPATPAGTSMVGVTLGKYGNLINAAFTKSPLAMYEPTDVEKNQDNNPIGSDQSSIAGKPYLFLNIGASNTIASDSPLKLSGTGFPPAAYVTIAIDDATVAKLTTSEKGELSVTITAPHIQGPHAVTALDAKGTLLDGAAFLVVHVDNN